MKFLWLSVVALATTTLVAAEPTAFVDPFRLPMVKVVTRIATCDAAPLATTWFEQGGCRSTTQAPEPSQFKCVGGNRIRVRSFAATDLNCEGDFVETFVDENTCAATSPPFLNEFSCSPLPDNAVGLTNSVRVLEGDTEDTRCSLPGAHTELIVYGSGCEANPAGATMFGLDCSVDGGVTQSQCIGSPDCSACTESVTTPPDACLVQPEVVPGFPSPFYSRLQTLGCDSSPVKRGDTWKAKFKVKGKGSTPLSLAGLTIVCNDETLSAKDNGRAKWKNIPNSVTSITCTFTPATATHSPVTQTFTPDLRTWLHSWKVKLPVATSA